MKVLIVEDDPGQIRLVKHLLERSGFEFKVQSADSVAAALAALKKTPPDVVLLDLTLGDSVGLTTVRTMARAARDVPIVVVTASDRPEIGLESLRLGAQDFLRKDEMDGAVLVRSMQFAHERKRVQLAQRERRHLREAVREAERVLGIVGHELRTPLAALRATTEFLLSPEAKESAEWDVFLHALHNEVIRMAELVNNMLEAARLNSRRSMWCWGPVNVTEACDAALNVLRPLVAHGRVELRCRHERENLHLRGDANAIQRLVLNLVSNSAKFTHDGFIELRTRQYLEGGRSWVELRVEDSGTGISEEVVSKLGDAFVLSAGALGSDYVKGTGLGLAICKAIVDVHGGELTVASDAGKGTVFTASLRADLERPMRGSRRIRREGERRAA
ncbi:MAG: hybrid sensor histidine kinase/response regulator [Phycisphaerales bacterium]|nr:hybrid sensor histidine kinase/response regulator [Phycisphaerales bacterium]